MTRIGTWNLAGRWTPSHHALIHEQDCDVWLLTEVNERVSVDGYHAHLGQAAMAANRRWAGILSRELLTPIPDPHPASAAGLLGAVTYCSSVLPWRSCGSRPPWEDGNHATKTATTMVQLARSLPQADLVWGGDWNHALSGREYSGSAAGRQAILEFTKERRLVVPTEGLRHRLEGLLSIDHIAISDVLEVKTAYAFDATSLSDHAGYVVEVL